MAIQATQAPSLTGHLLAYAACATGDQIVNNGRTVIYVKNGDSASHNVTVTSVAACNQGANHDLVVAVAAGEQRIIGPFATDRFNDVNGHVGLAYSALTSMEIAVVST